MTPSLGASGAICCVLGIFATLNPEAQMQVKPTHEVLRVLMSTLCQILFLPFLGTFSAATALKGLLVVDTAGLVLGWRLFDHAAHLAGLLLGVGVPSIPPVPPTSTWPCVIPSVS